MVMSALICIVALALVPVLAAVSYRRLGRATVPLALLAVMGATGSMFSVNDDWIPGLLTTMDLIRGQSSIWVTVARSQAWRFWTEAGPGALAVVAILWIILKIRRLPS